MKATDLILLLAGMVCVYQLSYAQSPVGVSKPELSLLDHRVKISYELINSTEDELYTVRVEITDSEGSQIRANTLYGDIGEHVVGGSTHTIYWDIEADSIYLDEDVFVQVYARAEVPLVVEEPVIEEPIVEEPVAEKPPTDQENIEGETFPEAEPSNEVVDQVTDEQIQEETGPKTDEIVKDAVDPALAEERVAEPVPGATERSFNRSSLILQSALLPGLGLSRAKGQPHWIKGIVGYGSIAGALYFNKQARTSYNKYSNPTSLNEVDNLYNQAERQDLISELMAYAAIGVWVTDLIWTFVGTSPSDNHLAGTLHRRISIGTTVEPVSSVPLVALRYTF